MKSRIKISQIVVCFVVMFSLILNSFSLSAFATDESTTVTVEKTYTFYVLSSDFPLYYNSPSSYVPSTYDYDDGTYTGTLNLTNASCGAPIAGSNGYLTIKIFATYSGTVYASADSKAVTVKKTYTFYVLSSDFPLYYNSPSSYVPSTYDYNDGTYTGTLNLTNASCGAPVGGTSGYLKVYIFAKYTGTVYNN